MMKNSKRLGNREDTVAAILAGLLAESEAETVHLLRQYEFTKVRKIIKLIPKILVHFKNLNQEEALKLLNETVGLLQRNNFKEAQKIAAAINKIFFRIHDLNETKARELICKAQILNNNLAKMRRGAA